MICRFADISLLDSIKRKVYDKKVKNKSIYIENYIKFAQNCMSSNQFRHFGLNL